MTASAPLIITSVDQLLAHAKEVENEAVERYDELAGQMEVHNNPRVSKLFRAMARIEQNQADRLNVMADGRQLPGINPTDFKWPELEAPESVPIGEGRYDMNEHEALKLALECEERAWAFFSSITAHSPDKGVKAMALQFADEERHHMTLIQAWIDRLPPLQPYLEDLDKPVDQE